jgi:protein TonB
LSRRQGETGVVVLRVELSETGHVAEAQVQSSSGFVRLDEAALVAVRTWRCSPATRNGKPVRAAALQPFNFILQGG